MGITQKTTKEKLKNSLKLKETLLNEVKKIISEEYPEQSEQMELKIISTNLYEIKSHFVRKLRGLFYVNEKKEMPCNLYYKIQEKIKNYREFKIEFWYYGGGYNFLILWEKEALETLDISTNLKYNISSICNKLEKICNSGGWRIINEKSKRIRFVADNFTYYYVIEENEFNNLISLIEEKKLKGFTIQIKDYKLPYEEGYHDKYEDFRIF